jgi:hypothetical protein
VGQHRGRRGFGLIEAAQQRLVSIDHLLPPEMREDVQSVSSTRRDGLVGDLWAASGKK